MEPQNPTPAAIENLKELIAELDRFKKEGRMTEYPPMAYLLANNAKVLIQQLAACEKENTKMRDAFIRLDELTQSFSSPNQCFILWGQIAEVVRTARKSLPTL